jgi:protein TonB
MKVSFLGSIFALPLTLVLGTDAGQNTAAEAEELNHLIRWQGTQQVKTDLPPYPAAAIAAGRAGNVDVELAIGTSGRILRHRLLTSAGEALDAAVLSTLPTWRIRPFQDAKGKVIPVLLMVQVEFRLARTGPSVAAAVAPVPLTLLAPGVQEPIEAFVDDGTVRAPRVRREFKPDYPDSARREHVQGEVTLDLVILPDGSVGRARVIRPLEDNLDKEALRTALRWQFTPPTRNGRPVSLIAELIMAFNLG